MGWKRSVSRNPLERGLVLSENQCGMETVACDGYTSEGGRLSENQCGMETGRVAKAL